MLNMAADSSIHAKGALLTSPLLGKQRRSQRSLAILGTNRSIRSGSGSFHGTGSGRGSSSRELKFLDVNAGIHIRDETFSSQSSSENEKAIRHPADEIGRDGTHKSVGDEKARACLKAKKQFEGDLMRGSISDLSHSLPSFSKHELLHGRFLGRGSTAQVSQVNGFRTNPMYKAGPGEDDNRDTTSETKARAFVVKHCYRDSGDARYAVKQLRKEVIEDPLLLLQGLADLNLEARLLSHMTLNPHPNVMKLRAVASGDRFSPDYFIVLDRLYDTLEHRIEKWKEKAKIIEGGPKIMVKSLLGSSAKRRFYADQAKGGSATLWHDRIWAAYDLASAVAHLHKHNIIHLGFDIRGDIKVFDLGLGKEMPTALTNDDGDDRSPPVSWKMTQMVGTPRYMAPEVAHGWAYNAKCDVFSYGIIFWQIMGIKSKPYSNHKDDGDVQFFVDCVWQGDLIRPTMRFKNRMIHAQYTTRLQQLTESCWDHRWHKRPSMMEVEAQLGEMVQHGAIIDTTESSDLMEGSLRFDLVGARASASSSPISSSARKLFFRRREGRNSSFDSTKSAGTEHRSFFGSSARSFQTTSSGAMDHRLFASSSDKLDQRLDRSRRRSTFVYDELSGSQKDALQDLAGSDSESDSDK